MRTLSASMALTALLLLPSPRRASAQETITRLGGIRISTTTADKPQSKVWHHDGRWWTVLASTSVSPSGTWLWRLGSDGRWTNVLRVSPSTTARADVKPVGELAHVLLFDLGSSALVTLEYLSDDDTYRLWAVRPTRTSITLGSSETATIDVDTKGRMWLATEAGSKVLVYYSDFPYTKFSGPVTLASNIASDDITVVTAMPRPSPPRIGVFWSNQRTNLFAFRQHVDGADPGSWSADEHPAQQSALDVGHGLADDHMNVKVGSDGTLFVAVKTSYDTRGFPLIALLVRHPNGRWDDLHEVDDIGTRPIVLLNEPADLVRVVYSANADAPSDVLYRDSSISHIGFGSRRTLMDGGFRNPTSAKADWTDEVVVLASGQGVIIRRPSGGAGTLDVRVAASADDAEEAQSGAVDLTSSDLELTEDGTRVQTIGMRFALRSIPRGATIDHAWVQFQVDEATSAASSLTVRAQAADDAPPFTAASGNLSARPTGRSIAWTPPAWPSVGAAGAAQRTPDLAGVLQEVVDRPGWDAGNAIAVLVRGSGVRTAESFDGTSAAAPLLHVEYTP
jgi:hypothetical protein